MIRRESWEDSGDKPSKEQGLHGPKGASGFEICINYLKIFSLYGFQTAI